MFIVISHSHLLFGYCVYNTHVCDSGAKYFVWNGNEIILRFCAQRSNKGFLMQLGWEQILLRSRATNVFKGGDN